MKKSKSVSSSKRKRRSPSRELGQKREKSSPHHKEKVKSKSKEKLKAPRKSRWEDITVVEPKEIKQQADPPNPPVSVEKVILESPSGIKDFLNEKPKIVEHLFLTINGAALQEIIPDYLKKRSIEELKQVCLEELEKMSKDDILHVISGNESSLIKEEHSVNIALKQTNTPKINESGHKSPSDRSQNVSRSNVTEPLNNVLVLCASPLETINVDDENQAPEEILEEVAKDLGVSDEGDAELLELEMRARAIRSLLKIKSQNASDSEIADFEE